MSRFLYAWEMGANLGHVGTFEPIARALAAGGHEVVFAVRETEQCAQLLGDGFAWLQAPIVSERMRPGAPLNYADILLRFGYDDPVRLRGILVAWRGLMQAVQPDLVLADHAPTAILAARTLGLPVMLFGSGFFCPPRTSPFPAMRPWERVDQAILRQLDGTALAVINRVLAELNVTPPLERLLDLFDVAENALLTLPELDHYPDRGDARYWGSLVFSGPRGAPRWPAGTGRRIFAYLRPQHPHFEQTLQAIAASACPTILYVPGWRGEALLAPSISVVTQPADLHLVAAQADVGIDYSGSTGCSFLLAGKPLLCLPTHLEQYLVALRIASLGAGIVISPEQSNPDIAGALQRLLAQSSFTEKAAEFARKYARIDQKTVIGNVVARALQLVAGSK